MCPLLNDHMASFGVFNCDIAPVMLYVKVVWLTRKHGTEMGNPLPVLNKHRKLSSQWKRKTRTDCQSYLGMIRIMKALFVRYLILTFLGKQSNTLVIDFVFIIKQYMCCYHNNRCAMQLTPMVYYTILLASRRGKIALQHIGKLIKTHQNNPSSLQS